MPLTPDANLEDPAITNVKGDKTTKFVVSNWTASSNTKAMLNNVGEEGGLLNGRADHQDAGEVGVQDTLRQVQEVG